MNYRWTLDRRYPDDADLEVQVTEDGWHIIAFTRYNHRDAHYACRFMVMEDNEFPDGKTFKTKRAAKKFCERHLPVMWIRHNTKTGDGE